MIKEKSCGALVYKEDSGIKILLIKHQNGGHWAFSKGHVEGEETEQETALREIKEETGLHVALDTGFRETVTYSPKTGVEKEVVYFAAKLESGRQERQAEEVIEIVWQSPSEALKTLTYQNDKELLEKFIDYLNS